MVENKDKKKVKKIHKEIALLKEKMKKIELRPCRGDADLKKKEQKVFNLKREIYELEKEANQFAIFIAGIGSS